MIVKPGASTEKMTDAMQRACLVAEDCYNTFGVSLILTSGDEETTRHNGRPVLGDTLDPHYLGKACDFSIHAVPPEKRLQLVDMLRLKLGPDFVVLWESKGTRNEHVHLQEGRIA